MSLVHAALLVLAALAADEKNELVARAEQTEFLIASKPTSRVEKDAEGNLIRLRLDGMALSAEEFAALARLTAVKHLTLNRTNVTAADLRKLHTLVRLETLQLNVTELGDDATGELIGFPALRSVCLGNVAMSPEAIERMKAQFQAADRRFAVGYSPKRR
jgi:hypothetical protein